MKLETSVRGVPARPARSLCHFVLRGALFASLALCTSSAWGQSLFFPPVNTTYSVGEVQWPLQANGGTSGPYTFSVIAGSLPPGVALRTDVPGYFPAGSSGLFGVATTPGTYNFTLRVFDGVSTFDQPSTFRITSLSILDYYSIPDGFVGVPYPPYTINVANNVGAVTFGHVFGLPPGVTLSAAGVISGTPTASNFYSINFSVTDTGTGTRIFRNINLAIFDIRITSGAVLPNATQGAAYVAALTASGGTPPYTWTSTSLPNGLTLDPTGSIAGTTTNIGRWSFSLTVTDSAVPTHVSRTVQASITIVGVPPALPSLQPYGFFEDCTLGVPCSRGATTSSGGTAPFGWSGSVPDGMLIKTGEGVTSPFITAGDGEMVGTPLAAGVTSVQITVTDSSTPPASATGIFPFRVSELLERDIEFGNPIVGVPFSRQLRIIGGRAPYSVTQLTGQLPPGLILDADGLVHGTPTDRGGYSANLLWTDADGRLLRTNNFFSVDAPGGGTVTVQIFTGANLGSANTGFYQTTFSACCLPSYKWTLQSGSFPPGLSLSQSGTLNGTIPASGAFGTYVFTLRVEDPTNVGNFAERQFTLIVTPITIAGSTTLADAFVGASYPATSLNGTGGTPPLTYALNPFHYTPPGLVLSSGGVLSGTPLFSGQYFFTVTITDSIGNVLVRTFRINVYPAGGHPPLNLPLAPNLGRSGPGFRSFTLSATGGVGLYHYSLSPGAPIVPGMRVIDGPPLPNGTPAGVTGVFAGVMTSPGAFATSIRVTDSDSPPNVFDRSITFTVTHLTITSQFTLLRATRGSPYSFAFTPYGGSESYSWSVSNLGALGADLAINTFTGVLSGTPNTAGGFSPTVTITDLVTGESLSFSFSLTVNPFAITTGGVLPGGTVGVPYAETLTAPGCGAPCVWTSISGFPVGVGLTFVNGTISGTPTGPVNSFFTAQVAGANGTVQKVFSLRIGSIPPQGLSISVTTLSESLVGNSVNQTLTPIGGTPPFTYSIVSGSLPPGVSLLNNGETLSAFNGPGFWYLSGRAMVPGLYSFTLQLTDGLGVSVQRTLNWRITQLSFQNLQTTALSNLQRLVAFNQTLLVAGGSGFYTWTATGLLPSGIALDPAGVVSGSPEDSGSYTTSIQGTDSDGNVATTTLSFVIGPTTLNFGAAPNLGTIQQGSSFTRTLTPTAPTAGTPPYTVTEITPLPPGLEILTGDSVPSGFPAGAIVLAGTPSTAGVFTFTLRVDDSGGNFGVRTFSLIVAPFVVSTTGALVDGSLGVPYSQTLLAPAAGAVAWSLSTTLPPGLSLSAAGVLSGTPLAVGNYNFTVVATDVASGVTVSTNLTLRVSNITMTDPPILPVGVIGAPYFFTFSAAGGGPGKTWSATGLPGALTLSPAGVLSGTMPSITAPFTIVVTVTDGVVPVTKRFLLTGRTPNPSVLNFTLAATVIPDLTAGQSLSFNLNNALSGGVGPYTWTAGGGGLPSGFTLVTGSALPPTVAQGTTLLVSAPLAAGDYTIDLVATDSMGRQIGRSFTLHLSTLNILPFGVRVPVLGAAYAQQFTPVGGTPPYTFTITPANTTTDMLPFGLALSPSGLLSGTTNDTGTYSMLLRVTDALGHTFARTVSITISNAQLLRVATNTVTDTWVGSGRLITLAANPLATTPTTYTWTIVGGALPPGMYLTTDPAIAGPNGAAIAGRAEIAGSFTFRVRVAETANPANFAERNLTAKVVPFQLVAPRAELFGTDLPSGQVGSVYTTTIRVAGGTPPYSFVESPLAPLPPGLSLSVDGVLSGTPTAIGAFSIVPVISDAAGHVLTSPSLTLFVTAAGTPTPLLLTSTTGTINLPPMSVGVPHVSSGLPRVVRGGVPPFFFTLASGSSLPPGIALISGSNGVPDSFGGIPTTPGPYSFSFDIQDSAGQTATLGVVTGVSSLVVTPATIPDGFVGTPYTQSLVPTGGVPPYSLQLNAAADLPPGLTFSAAGVLTGTPTNPGSFQMGTTTTDAASNTLTKPFRITIDNAAGEAQAVALAPRPIQVYYVRTTPAAAPVPVSVSVNTTSGTALVGLSLSGIPGATLSTSTGTAPMTVHVNFDVTGLDVGTYAGVMGVNAPESVSLWDLVPVTLTVSDPPPCSYAVNPTAGAAAAAGDSGAFDVLTASHCTWTALPSDSWVTLTSAAGGTGTGTISYSVSSNPGINARNGSITVNGAVHSITQFGSACSFAINPPSVSATASGGGATISVTASNAACSWRASGLGVTPDNGTGNGVVSLTIPPNPLPASVVLTAMIAGQTFTGYQGGIDCVVGLSPYDASYPAAGGSGSVSVTLPAGCGYDTVAGPGWLTVTSGGSGVGPTGTLAYDVEPNSTTFSRAGSLTIGGQTFTVTQAQLACSITVDTSGLGTPYGPAGGTGSIVITTNGSNCSWTALSGAPWISVSPSSGSGNAALSVNVLSNAASIVARSTDLTVGEQTIGVSQNGTTCSYSLQSSTAGVPASGGSGVVGVVAANVCGWSAVSNGLSWLTITAAGSAGTGNVTFVAAANPSSAPRIGSLTIAGLLYTVNQAGAACSFTSGAGSGVSVSEDGGTGSFPFSTATVGCSPTAVSYAGWLGVTTTFGGTSGTVEFTLPANPSNTTRAGTIQVGDLTFAVTQLGAPCGYSLASYGAVFNSLGGSGNVFGSPSATSCTPTVGTTQPAIISLGMLSGPTLNIFTQPYTVSPFVSLTTTIRRGTITFGGQVYVVKQTSW